MAHRACVAVHLRCAWCALQMNGTLISHPPDGRGSGSSVTNGGPAWMDLVASKKPMANPADESFMWRSFRADKINRDSEAVQRAIIYVSA
jgi:hypothetical protein